MSTKLPSAPTPTKFAEVWVKEVLTPAVESLANPSGQVHKADLQSAGLQGVSGLALDNLTSAFESHGSQTASRDTLLDLGYRYALEHATRVAGADGRISALDAQTLPLDLQGDFKFLRTGEMPAARIDTQGYRFSQRVLDDVISRYGISDGQALINAAIGRSADSYLNRSELEEAAKALSTPAPAEPSGFRWTPSTMARVMSAHHLTDEDALLREAAKHDNGNRYLSRSELEAAAKVLTQQAPPAPVEIGIISDLDKTIIPGHRTGEPLPIPYPGIQTLLHELEFGGGRQAGDLVYVTARTPDRVVDIPDYINTHNLPSGNIETGTSSVPWVAEPEKVRDASKAFEANPEKKFVLFGDSSHRDPEVYRTLLQKYPDQVHAAFIHKVNATVKPERVEGLHLVENYAEAAAILFEKGVLDEAAARRVMVSAQLQGLDITDAQIDALIANHQP